MMLTQLYEGMNRFLRTLFDENFLASAQISAGFHYPVRTQYATLHMQVRVNSGSVCRDDGRGIDIHSLIENLQSDRFRYHRDDETLRYQVTENIKVSLLAAANEYAEEHPGQEVVRHTNPLAFDLGFSSMPTIKDEGEEDATDDDPDKADVVGEYIINLQPTTATPYCEFMYEKRKKCAELFGKDASYLYPLHVSVTGFFETNKAGIQQLIGIVEEVLSEELSELRGQECVQVREVLSVNAGYVLQDLSAPSISAFAKTLSGRCQQEIGLDKIRGKNVNHISLAMGRPDPELRRKIQDIYADDPGNLKSKATFDIVVSKRIFRGSIDKMEEDGPHQFKEVFRIPTGVVANDLCITAPAVPDMFDEKPKPRTPEMCPATTEPPPKLKEAWANNEVVQAQAKRGITRSSSLT
jgi:hypothetical protein